MKRNKILIIALLLITFSFAQKKEKVEITGRTLIGKEIDGQRIKEVVDEVIIKHGKTKITCNKAIQFIDTNEIELFGNVVVVKDSVIIFTERGFYRGNDEVAYSNNSLVLDDGKVILTAKKGFYFLNEERAEFYNDVSMFDSESKLFAQKLIYWKETEKAVATGEVKLSDTSSVVFSDSLITNKKTNDTFAYQNVRVVNKDNELNVYGSYLEHKSKDKYSKVLGKPLLVQVDTSSSGVIDTLMIKSVTMEMFGDSLSNKLIATDSVEIIRGDFLAKNNRTIYYKGEERLYTEKSDLELAPQPIMWFTENQLSGDTINVYLKNNNIDFVDVRQEAFILSTFPEFDFRFNQISGDSVKIFFKDSNIDVTDVKGNVLSIYYLFDEEEENGLIKSSSEDAKLIFKDNSIDEVKFYVSVENEFHPEAVIENNEKDFTLPRFFVAKQKPVKKEFLKRIKNNLK
ncbi:MAG: OstA-like protein [Rhodothermaceae bacterium]